MTTNQPATNHGPSIPPQDPTPADTDQPSTTHVPLIQPEESTDAGSAGTEPNPSDQRADATDQPEADWTQLKADPAAESSSASIPPTNAPSELITGTETAPAGPQWLTDLRAKYENSALPGMLLAAGVIVLVLVMMRRLARKKPKATPAIPNDERIGAIREQALASITPLERSLADAEELTRRLAATLDNKADRIDLLIQEADRKLDELNRANATVARQTPLPAPDRAPRTQRAIDPSLMDRARVEQDRAERAPTDYAREPEHNEPAPQAEIEETKQPIHHRIWALADDGVPTVEIAQSLNQPVGQVELILNLRKSG